MVDRRESFYQTRLQEMADRYPGFDLSSAEVMLNLFYTYDVVTACSSKFLAEHGLAKSSFNILLNLRHGPAEGMLLHDLGEVLLMTRANVTGLIDHLEERALVKRVVDATDRRARFARITKKGEALMDEVAPLHFQRAHGRLGKLTPEERDSLVKLLKKLRYEFKSTAESGCEDSAVAVAGT
jgi:MarR family transcriptional regulator, 2-MHQ and catechol-resistance regulon repressor